MNRTLSRSIASENKSPQEYKPSISPDEPATCRPPTPGIAHESRRSYHRKLDASSNSAVGGHPVRLLPTVEPRPSLWRTDKAAPEAFGVVLPPSAPARGPLLSTLVWSATEESTEPKGKPRRRRASVRVRGNVVIHITHHLEPAAGGRPTPLPVKSTCRRTLASLASDCQWALILP